jgi:hypothetical protein
MLQDENVSLLAIAGTISPTVPGGGVSKFLK